MDTLKQLRKAKGVTQQEVADYLGVNRVSYTDYENGKNKISPERLSKLADYFGVSVDVLLGRGDGEQPSAQWPKTITPAKKPVGRNYRRFPVYAFLSRGFVKLVQTKRADFLRSVHFNICVSPSFTAIHTGVTGGLHSQ